MSPQQTIGHYRVTAKLGEGGMGAVYRATDTILGRDVAVKLLSPALAGDADYMARFQREAKVLASLNHPNIATIHGLEEADGVRALVMELVEGPTLADRIVEGAFPLEEALSIAKQIAEALEAAHEKGIVHRDLKPANVKVTPQGAVKVLDFGLAQAAEPSAPKGDAADSPTLTIRATQAGLVIGTAGYMSPEQAAGKPVDRRADIWSFGVVLWEMLTRTQLFAGETVTHTLANVLKGEIDYSMLPASTPVAIRELLRRCLDRNLKSRLQAMGEARIAIEKYLADPAGAFAIVEQPATRRSRRSVVFWAAAAGVLAVIAAATSWMAWRGARSMENALLRLSVDLGPAAMTGLNLTVAISPDGKRLVYPARGPDDKPQLEIRLLDQAQGTPLAGTAGGTDPFFSPDGQWVGFFADNKMKKVSIQGGGPVNLCDAVFDYGASWGEDGTIVAALSLLSSLSRVSAGGRRLEPLTKLGRGEATHRWPQVLPGGQAVLFTAASSGVVLGNSSVQAMSLKTGATKILQPGAYFGRYLPTNGRSGHLLYLQQGVLFGVPFDPGRLEMRGTPTPLLEDVAANPALGGGQFDFSATGTFVYLAGKGAAQQWSVVWLDSSGRTQPLLATPAAYTFPRFSPDGRLLAVQITSRDGTDIYLYDWGRDALTRLTFTGHAQIPVWAPDGKHIAYESVERGFEVWWVRSDGSGEAQRLLESQNNMAPWSFSPNGRRLAYFETNPETAMDIWTLPLDISDPDRPKVGKPEPFLRTPASENVPVFSPDGRWIAYRSTESGTTEIFVRPYPARSGGKWQISTGGGLYAIWSNNGRELFYQTVDNRIMVAGYTAHGDSFEPGKPRVWSDKKIFYAGGLNMSLANDGKRFAVFPMPEATGGEKGPVHVTFLLNFFDELRRRLP
jgi:Tol biopolymer transport system component